ncbi:MAG: type I methionyl aminopeptidase [Acidimicrobiales bacterium]
MHRPAYTDTGGVPASRSLAPLVDSEDVARLRRACRAARRVLDRVAGEVRPGVTTDELDQVAHDSYLVEGGYPSTLGYRGYPKSICTSVNEVVAHGIPDDRPLQAGDIVNCDVTIYLDGMHGDCSRTICVGGREAADPATLDLVTATERALRAGIAAVRPGGRVRDIGRAVQRVAGEAGHGIVRELVGHGIGEQFHGEPHVHHYDEPRNRAVARPGMAFTIEPMLTLGMPDVVLWSDGWTIATLDGMPSAQFEHTVVVTSDGVEVLTVADDGDPAYPVV